MSTIRRIRDGSSVTSNLVRRIAQHHAIVASRYVRLRLPEATAQQAIDSWKNVDAGVSIQGLSSHREAIACPLGAGRPKTSMILRLSQKLGAKIKAGKLSELPLDENPYADWSGRLFTAGRTQYILLSNTASLYSCVMFGAGVTDDSRFIERALSAIREFMEDDGQIFAYRKFIAPSSATVKFANALSRQVTGSLNELVLAATCALESGEVAPHDVGFELNEFLLSAIAPQEGRRYGRPKEAFKKLRVDEGRR